MGDFNSIPTSLAMDVIRDHAQLTDGWVATHPENDSFSGSPDPAEAIEHFGVTADSPLCTYSAGKPLDDHARQFFGKRLDYVLFRGPVQIRGPVLRCTQTKVVFTDTVPRQSFSHSDHFGLESTFRISSRPPRTISASSRGLQKADAVSGGDDISEPISSVHLTDESLGTMVDALTTCSRLSRQRSRKYLAFLGGSVCLLVTCIVGSAWLPRSWANPIVVLIAAVATWFGTTMLYIGFVYGRWEVNALQNIIEELEIHRSTIVDRSR
jgi:sphingomyelin phosphodiesterase 2